MKPAHYVLLVLLVCAFIFPKMIWWLVGATFLVGVVLLALSGPTYIASLFLPRQPKQ